MSRKSGYHFCALRHATTNQRMSRKGGYHFCALRHAKTNQRMSRESGYRSCALRHAKTNQRMSRKSGYRSCALRHAKTNQRMSRKGGYHFCALRHAKTKRQAPPRWMPAAGLSLRRASRDGAAARPDRACGPVWGWWRGHVKQSPLCTAIVPISRANRAGPPRTRRFATSFQPVAFGIREALSARVRGQAPISSVPLQERRRPQDFRRRDPHWQGSLSICPSRQTRTETAFPHLRAKRTEP